MVHHHFFFVPYILSSTSFFVFLSQLSEEASLLNPFLLLKAFVGSPDDWWWPLYQSFRWPCFPPSRRQQEQIFGLSGSINWFSPFFGYSYENLIWVRPRTRWYGKLKGKSLIICQRIFMKLYVNHQFSSEIFPPA